MTPLDGVLAQLCPILCNPMDCSAASSSVHGIFQVIILEWVAISSSRRSSPPRCWTHISSISCIVGRFFTPRATWKLLDNLLISLICVRAKSLQLCPTLCDPMDCSPQGSSIHGIVQARILEWVTMPSSRRSPDPGIEPASLMSPALADGFFYY